MRLSCECIELLVLHTINTVSFASRSTAHAYFQEWVKFVVFDRRLRLTLEFYDESVGVAVHDKVSLER